jgi:hypothetical protein
MGKHVTSLSLMSWVPKDEVRLGDLSRLLSGTLDSGLLPLLPEKNPVLRKEVM